MKKYLNFVSNLNVLLNAKNEDLENEFIISGIIDKFFIQFELGWKVMKEALYYEGSKMANTGSPREIIKEAYTIYYDFMNEEIWIDMLKSRNDMTHIYDGEAAGKLVAKVLDEFIPEFQRLKNGLVQLYGENLEKID